MRRHRLVQRNDSWPSIIFYLVDLVSKRAPLFPGSTAAAPYVRGGGGIQFLALYRALPFACEFVLGITKPSLAFVNHTKAEHPTMARPP